MKATNHSRSSNQVRIVGGVFRRRVLHFPDVEGLRPTPDRVRETLFNWLGQTLPGWRCLDLFAGSGALGFEAASRECARVVMVEQSRAALAALRQNRDALGAGSVEIVAGDSLAWLRNTRERFDLVLLDPPFASDYAPRVLADVGRVLADGGLVYLEAFQWPDTSQWDVLRRGKAGVVHYGLLCPPSLEGGCETGERRGAG